VPDVPYVVEVFDLSQEDPKAAYSELFPQIPRARRARRGV